MYIYLYVFALSNKKNLSMSEKMFIIQNRSRNTKNLRILGKITKHCVFNEYLSKLLLNFTAIVAYKASKKPPSLPKLFTFKCN